MNRAIMYGSAVRSNISKTLTLGFATLVLMFGVGLSPRIACAQTYNYAEALQKAIYFYDCQRSGTLPGTNRVPWRGNSALGDGSDVGKDLTGGWYDAGDNVKFGFPMAGSTTVLAWGVIENRQAYVNSGQLNAILDNLHWVCDYFIKCHTAPNEFYGQVGTGGADHAWWGPAEVMQMARPAAKIDTTHPGSDLAGETAAALAACSMVFQPTDPTYAATLLQHAKDLYSFADTYRGVYTSGIPDAAGYYNSFSGYNDELVWGAAWLYRATNDSTYLTKAQSYYANLAKQTGQTVNQYKWTHAWDDKSFGTYVLMAKITGATNEATSPYLQDAERWLNWWTVGGAEWGADNTKVNTSPGGLGVLDIWASLRYAADTSFCALVFSDYLASVGGNATKITRYHDFAVSQIRYALGSNPAAHSYEIGFGTNPPSHEHHRTSHGSWLNDINTPVNQRHILYGALVGGPDASDSWTDTRGNYQQNEVACDYNAAFTGALARLYNEFGGGSPLAGFPGIETKDDDEEYVMAGVNASGANFTEIKAEMVNKSGWPARMGDHLSFRYFFTLEPGVTPAMITISSSLQGGATITGPTLYSGSTYYVNVDLTGQLIYPGGQSQYIHEVQFRLTSSGAWDPTNDWSYSGVALPAGAAPVKVTNVPVYDHGIRVFGFDPSGATAPGAPTGLVATPGNTQVALTWTATPFATSYNVSRSTVSGSGYASVATAIAANSYTNTGLTNGTTYYFVVSATNSIGTGPNSAQASGTPAPPPPPPPAPTGLTATSGNGQVALAWNAASGANSYNVKRSTVSGSGYATVTTVVTTSYTNAGLSNGITYYFVVSGLNGGGEGPNSAQASATPAGPPAPPTGVTATAGAGQVALSWTASATATTYNVKRSTVSGSGYVTVGSPATTSFTNTGLAAGATYYYVVTAVNSLGESGNSSEVNGVPSTAGPVAIDAGGSAAGTFVADTDFSGGTAAPQSNTGAVDTTAVTNPAPVAVYQSERWGVFTYTMGGLTVGGNYTVRLHFTEDYVTAAGQRLFNVVINGTQVLTNFDIFAAAGAMHKANIQQFTATGNASGQIVIAFNNGSIQSPKVDGIEIISSTPTVPPVPTGLTATPGNAQVALAWNASSGATSYNVSRSTVSGSGYASVATGVAATAYTNTGLTNGTTYYFVVSATNSVGTSANSAQASATPTAPQPPAAPTNLAATPGNAQVSLTWTASAGATSYNVLRSTVSGSGYASIITGLATTSYVCTGETNGTTYYFVVTATNAAGTSGNSNQASATPIAPPAAPTGVTATAGNAQVTVAWTASAGATSYNILRSTVNGSGYVQIINVATTSYICTGETNGTTYYFVVQAVNAGGTSANSAQVSATPTGPPAAPTGLTATGGNTQVALTWTASAGATAYDVKRSTVSGSGYATVSSPTVANYTNTGLTNGTTYFFVVDAKNASGTSANSAQVSATPAAPQPPAAPTNLAATPGNAQVALTWTASTGATSYNVSRSTVSGSGYASVATGIAVTNYTNTGLTNGTTYYFVVSATNAVGTSANSAQASATPTAATSTLKVQYKCNMTTSPTNQVMADFEIFNTGATAVAMNTLKIRYYYTIDTVQPETFYCDYAMVGSGNVSATFNALSPTKPTADNYLEVSFSAAAGNINAGANSGEVQARFNKNDWSNFTQSNDYSFDATKTAFADWTHVCLYQNGVLVWGTPP